MKNHNFIPSGEVAEVEITYKSKVKPSERTKVTDSRITEKLMRPFFEQDIEHHEVMFMICLNKANRAIATYKISSGGTAGTVADPKMMFQCALLANASGIIIAHNHPSGNLTASPSDIDLTKKVKEAGKFLEIQLLDSMIITAEGYFSMADEGLL